MGRLGMALALAVMLSACSNIKVEQTKSENSSGISITDIQKQDATFGGCQMPDGSCQSYWFRFGTDLELVDKAIRLYSRDCANNQGSFATDLVCLSNDLKDSNYNECFSYQKSVESSMTVLTSKIYYLEAYVRSKKKENAPAGSNETTLSESDLDAYRNQFFMETDIACKEKGGTPLQAVFENSK